MSLRIAVVTGANKGIGFATAKQLAQTKGLHVILAARDESRGREAANNLHAAGLANVEFHQLDIDDQSSISSFADFVKGKYGGIDILVNNAAIAFKGNAFDEHVARTTLGTNYFGTLNVLNTLLPLVRTGGRVVNVSSSTASLKRYGPELRNKFLDPNITVNQVSALMNKFIDDVRTGTWSGEGWPGTTYGVSKAGLTAMTRALARDEKRDVLINCIDPGYVDTDMSSHRGHLTPDQGAETSVFAALLPAGSKLTGRFFINKTEVPWEQV
eukprot:TRINITY_DN6971_c0_g1_i1.p1 TRINITY_DN6971_c0_g1~~TRINITY_DN6971_c0_g1_i1.p1  ORF type:complete len:270 (-),score=66.71 TRINITY_DN6971_c0_g1_i1:210-1019(-)